MKHGAYFEVCFREVIVKIFDAKFGGLGDSGSSSVSRVLGSCVMLVLTGLAPESHGLGTDGLEKSEKQDELERCRSYATSRSQANNTYCRDRPHLRTCRVANHWENALAREYTSRDQIKGILIDAIHLISAILYCYD